MIKNLQNITDVFNYTTMSFETRTYIDLIPAYTSFFTTHFVFS